MHPQITESFPPDVADKSRRLSDLLSILVQSLTNDSAEKSELESCAIIAWEISCLITKNVTDIARSQLSSYIVDNDTPYIDSDLLGKGVSTNNPPLSSIGQRIRHVRKSTDLKQQHVASATGVTVQAISLWENDQSIPTSDKIIPLANALKCDPMWLLTGESSNRQVSADSGK